MLPFGPKTPVAAQTDDALLVGRGAGAVFEIEKILMTDAATATQIALGIDAHLGSTAWRTGGGGGNTVLSGAGAASGGANGDFYIRTGSWTISGPKAGGVWPAPVSLIGADGSAGTPGTNGATVLSGAGAASGGANGDFYLRTSDWTISGPKAGGVWPAPVSLVGPRGLDGGAAAAGNNGREIELQNGATYLQWRYVGDVSWTNLVAKATLIGPAGEVGSAGTPGAAGSPGADGKTILSGSGAPGAGVGVTGDFYLDPAGRMIYGPKAGGVWPAGISLSGAAGTAGVPGTNGTGVLSGTAAPTAGLGGNGDFYINTSTWVIHGPKAGGVWPSGARLMLAVEVVTALPPSPDPGTFYVIGA